MSEPEGPVRLRIEPVVSQAAELANRVASELKGHEGLLNAARLVSAAAATAGRVSKTMKRPLSLHRLPVLFLAAALVGLTAFIVWQFAWVSTLSLALPDRDASLLKRGLDGRVKVEVRRVPGSREAAELLAAGRVDLGFIQGGVPFPPQLARLELPGRELVLLFLRDGLDSPAQVHRVLTSVKGEGSHSVAEVFFTGWGLRGQVEYLHGWTDLTHDPAAVVPAEVDAVFVVKDTGDEQTLDGVLRLVKAGFHLVSPRLGARAEGVDYLAPAVIPPGHLNLDPPIPSAPVETYSVATYLVARDGLTPSLLTQAANVVAAHPRTIAEGSFRLSGADFAQLLQGVDAFFSILLNIALAFLGLLGLDMMAYRKQFHELNSLVSLISMLQSSKDVLGVTERATRAENLLYMRLCSDLLGLISAVAGYYTQENSSLLFNNLSEIVHQRCDALKINIQLKLLQAMVKED
jgi:hypothetical protein